MSNLMVTLFLGCISLFMLHIGRRELKDAVRRKLDKPLTRHNLSELPASETLVRGASEPEQQQSEMLLRAAQNAGEVPQEQLLRPR